MAKQVGANVLDKSARWAAAHIKKNPQMWNEGGHSRRLWHELSTGESKTSSLSDSAGSGDSTATPTGAGVRLVKDSSGQWVEEVDEDDEAFVVDPKHHEAFPLAQPRSPGRFPGLKKRNPRATTGGTTAAAAAGGEAGHRTRRKAFLKLYTDMYDQYAVHSKLAGERMAKMETDLAKAKVANDRVLAGTDDHLGQFKGGHASQDSRQAEEGTNMGTHGRRTHGKNKHKHRNKGDEP